MSEVTRYHHQDTGALEFVLASDYDKLRAERDDLRAKLATAREALELGWYQMGFVLHKHGEDWGRGDREGTEKVYESMNAALEVIKTHEMALKLASAIDRLRAKLARAVHELGLTAAQRTSYEVIEEEGGDEYSDYRGAYDIIIEQTRKALAAIEEAV